MKKLEKKLVYFLFAVFFATFAVDGQSTQGNVGDYGVFTFQNLSSNLLMEVEGDTLWNEKYKDNALIVQNELSLDYQSLPAKWQRWHVIYQTTEDDVKYYYIRSAMSGKFLDVPSAATTEGVQMQQYREFPFGVPDQMLWRISEVSPGEYKILNKNSGLALSASGIDEGAAITQTAYVGDNIQLWQMNEQALCTYRDDEVVRFFERNKVADNYGSTAFDQGSSIPLSDGNILWVTQDAWDSWQLTDNNLFPSNHFFTLGNSMYIQPDVNNWNPDDALNITRENSAQNKPKQICDIQEGETFAWPGNGVQLDGKVYVHCGEGVGLGSNRQVIYEIWPTAEGSYDWNAVRHKISNLTPYNEVGYPNGMIKADDGYVYVFGSRNVGFGYWFELYVARFSQNDPLNSWTFWDGSSWADTPPLTETEFAEAQIYNGFGAALAVNYVNGKYVVISLDQGFWDTEDRYIRATVSDSPTGGFGAQKTIYSICEYIYGEKVRYYTPNVHPQFDNGHNELLVTYSVNFSVKEDQNIKINADGVPVENGEYIDPYFYRVKGVRIPYSLIGIPDNGVPNSINAKVKEDLVCEIYPNPADDFVNIKANVALQHSAYKIVSVDGSMVASGYVDERQIDLQKLSPGFYVLFLKKGDAVISKRIVKK
jgi:hypothetical protein